MANDTSEKDDGTHPIGDSVNEYEDEDDIGGLNDEEREEYESLNQTLDHISTCLDDLEKRNDSLNAQFRELLEMSRASRSENQQINEQNEPEGDPPKYQ